MHSSLASSSENRKDKKTTPIFLLVFLAIVFMFGSILVFSELVQYQKKVMSAAEEDALWASYQLDKELIKLRTSLQLLDKSYTEENLENTIVRFEILYSRVNVLGSGKLKALFSRSPDSIDILNFIRSKVDEMDSVIFSSDRVDVNFLLEESKYLINKTEGFILDVLGARALEKEKNRQVYQNLLIYLGGLIALLTITVMFIVYILFKQLSVLKKSYEKSQQLAIELEKAVVSSEQALRVKSDFIATMSHEIRTPMNAIIGFSYLLMNSDVPEKYREQIHSIQKAANGLLTIINGILDFSKIESGNLELENHSFEIDRVLEYVYQVNEANAKNKGLDFLIYRDFSMSDSLIGDETRLQQVLINLVSNAIKFTEVGSITVRVYKNYESELVIEVNDTGIGIREGVDIFDVFKQADSSTTRLYGGTGLGLSITQKIVQLLDGHISYQSKKKIGSQFLVILPYLPDIKKSSRIIESIALIKEDSVTFDLLNGLNMDHFVTWNIENISSCQKILLTSATFLNSDFSSLQSKKDFFKKNVFFYGCHVNSKKRTSYSGLITPKSLNEEFKKDGIKKIEENNVLEFDKQKKLKSSSIKKVILLAEDNKVNANIVMAILNKMNISIDWVENGEEAYNKSILNSYDLIIMDIRMPIMDGYQASEKIYYTLKERKPPIIVLTADVVNIEKDNFKNCFFDDVLFKPLDLHDFIKKVSFWFDNENFNKADDYFIDHSSKVIVNTNSELINELDKLEELLLNGDVGAMVSVKKIMDVFSDVNDIDSIKLAIEDIENYDYQDALMRIENFKKIFFHNVEEGGIID